MSTLCLTSADLKAERSRALTAKTEAEQRLAEAKINPPRFGNPADVKLFFKVYEEEASKNARKSQLLSDTIREREQAEKRDVAGGITAVAAALAQRYLEKKAETDAAAQKACYNEKQETARDFDDAEAAKGTAYQTQPITGHDLLRALLAAKTGKTPAPPEPTPEQFRIVPESSPKPLPTLPLEQGNVSQPDRPQAKPLYRQKTKDLLTQFDAMQKDLLPKPGGKGESADFQSVLAEARRWEKLTPEEKWTEQTNRWTEQKLDTYREQEKGIRNKDRDTSNFYLSKYEQHQNDCSALVQHIMLGDHRGNGIATNFPNGTSPQKSYTAASGWLCTVMEETNEKSGKFIPTSNGIPLADWELQYGDVVFFSDGTTEFKKDLQARSEQVESGDLHIDHVAIYVGDGMIMDCSPTKPAGVNIRPMEEVGQRANTPYSHEMVYACRPPEEIDLDVFFDWYDKQW